MGTVDVKNIFGPVPAEISEEFLEILAESETVRIERIVSQGHVSPKDFWYDQKTDEFVIVLKGRAHLLFEGAKDHVDLESGDYLCIPAHVKHRVEWTDPECDTIWLAVQYRP